MADKRAYFKVDVGYLTNPKIAALAIESPTAVLLHIGSIGYCAQHLTDGVVPIALILRLTGATLDDAGMLIARELWTDQNDGNAIVHDYLEHQRSAADAQHAEASGRKAAIARWDATRNASGMRPASEGGMRREKEREKELLVAPVAAEAKTDDNDAVTSKRKPETTLSPSWAPTVAHLTFAAEKHVDLMEAVRTFRNHADTNDRRCRNWNGAFHTWLDKSKPTLTATPRTGSSIWDRKPPVRSAS